MKGLAQRVEWVKGKSNRFCPHTMAGEIKRLTQKQEPMDKKLKTGPVHT